MGGGNEPIQGNPLAALTPTLVGGKVVVAKLPEAGVVSAAPAQATAASLAVEPAFLERVAAEQAGEDSEMVRLRAKAQGSDAGFLFKRVHGLDLMFYVH